MRSLPKCPGAEPRGESRPRILPPHPEHFPPVCFMVDLLCPQKDFKQSLIVNRPSVKTKKKKSLHKHQGTNKTRGAAAGLPLELLRRCEVSTMQSTSKILMRALPPHACCFLSGRPTSFSTQNTSLALQTLISSSWNGFSRVK